MTVADGMAKTVARARRRGVHVPLWASYPPLSVGREAAVVRAIAPRLCAQVRRVRK